MFYELYEKSYNPYTIYIHQGVSDLYYFFFRTRAQNGKPQTVYGALIGKQAGRDIEVNE